MNLLWLSCLADYAFYVPIELAHFAAVPGLAVPDPDRAGVVGDGPGGLKPFPILSAAAVTSSRTSPGTAAPNGATAIIPSPRPCRTIAGLKVPAITLFAVAAMNGPQVNPSPVSQPFGASCRASMD